MFPRWPVFFIWKYVTNLCTELLINLNLDTKQYIGICGPNIVNWLIADVACVLSQVYISVPIHTTADLENVVQIANMTEIQCVVCSWESYQTFFLHNAEKFPKLKKVIVMDKAELGMPHSRYLYSLIVVYRRCLP